MNMATIGTLSSRYARALYAYALDNNEEEKVYDEMKYLSHGFLTVPELRKTLQNPILSFETKEKVLETATGSNTTKCVKHFFEFIFSREKQDLLLFIATAYLSVYRKAKNVLYVDLISAVEPERDFVERIKTHILKEYNSNVVVEMSITLDPAIIGGFILNVDGKQLDLSVKGELKKIRESILKNL
jgi:F-type H+-transporting ATPase subunit delta